MQAGERNQAMMQLIFALRSSGVTDRAVLDAMEAVPRDLFVEGTFHERAYENHPLPISCGQTISQPSIVGRMTQALNVTSRCKVLEIGAGSGYQSAILAHLARRVYALERHRPLALLARSRIEQLGISNVTIRAGDGTRGWPEQAPFDRILIAAAADDAPKPLLDQLRVGGIMVLPVGQSDEVQQLIKIEKTESGYEYSELGDVLFVPLVEGMAEDPGS
ncbi:protein-L-isoaspartate(D-aspartate) O-methyltransferase [Rhodobacteraceae bacterium NNCM2]|nr:protein-L-isoaspartate(D-aspartate) O-methyltransferase [Coraliihabitans acroporae]